MSCERPRCGGNLFCGVNRVKDPARMTDLEKQRVPVITAPDFVKKGERSNVSLEVGKYLAHPNERGHHIEFIDLCVDDSFIATADLTCVAVCPKATFCVRLDHIHGKLRAFENCNLHGTWEGHWEIEVKA